MTPYRYAARLSTISGGVGRAELRVSASMFFFGDAPGHLLPPRSLSEHF